jgi:hypothetical protein
MPRGTTNWSGASGSEIGRSTPDARVGSASLVGADVTVRGSASPGIGAGRGPPVAKMPATTPPPTAAMAATTSQPGVRPGVALAETGACIHVIRSRGRVGITAARKRIDLFSACHRRGSASLVECPETPCARCRQGRRPRLILGGKYVGTALAHAFPGALVAAVTVGVIFLEGARGGRCQGQ